MDVLAHIRLLAQYNRWMNDKLYRAAAELPREAIAANRGAFFGSLLGTLNHLLVGDTIWMRRLATHPAGHVSLEPVRGMPQPPALDHVMHADFTDLAAARQRMDAILIAWAAELAESDLGHVLEYSNMKGVPQRKLYGSLVLNLFNHQTHHRGQATTLLFQAGVDVGVTDLLAMIPDQAPA